MRNKTNLSFLLAAMLWPTASVIAAADGANSMPEMDMHDMDMSPSAKPAPVKITDAWMRALPSGLPAGGYFTLRNNGGTQLELTGASSPACGTLMLHKSENTGGMSHMSGVTSIEIAPKGTLAFAPGGYHLMCMNPKDLKPGSTATVTLKFSNGSQADAKFAVRSATGN